MPAILQRSFAGGEVAPALYGRADQTKYQTGLRACRNFFVQRFGGVANRPGTELVCEVDDHAVRHRLVKFVFNSDQTYVLVFGDLTMHVVRNGAELESSPGVPYELATPYVEADLPELNYVQSGDVISLVHPSYAPRELSRTGHTSWTLSVASFTPAISRPTGCTASAGAAGSNSYRYRVTAVSADNGEESLPGVQAAKNITAATKANPCVITSVAHGFKNGDDLLIESVGGMTELNDRVYRIANKTADTFELQGVDSTNYTTYTSGGTAKRTSINLTSAAAPTSGSPHTISWTAVSGALEYNVYKESNGLFGYIGTSETTSFNDTNITAATQYAPPQESDVFSAAGDYPSAVTYFQQRKGYANTDDETERVWFSRTGAFTNFTTSNPVQDDDSIEFQLAGRQVNEVRHLIEIGGKLVLLTSGSEVTIEGDSDGVLRPSAINPRVRGYNGAASQPAPIAIADTLLYVQARGGIVRDLLLDDAGAYKNRDLTIFAPHLFEGYTISAWDFQQIPHSIAWAVRSDGTLLGLTYLREHEVYGWHRHDTGADDGDTFEDVVCVPEGDEDAVYVIVNRTIGVSTKRYVERFQTRRIDAIEDVCFLDSSLTYDGTNDTATTLTLSGGTTWSNTEDLTLTASASIFVAGDVGNRYVIESGTDTVTVEVIAYTSGTVVTVRAIANVPAALRSTALTTWAKAVDQVSGLDHLEGRTVGALGDGNVIANGLEDEPIVVTGGIADLGRPYVKIRVGLPIVAEIQTLDIDTPEGGTLIERRKRINRVNLRVESSRGVRAGPNISGATLREYPQRTTEAMGEPTALRTGIIEIPIGSTWSDGGSVIVRQNDPLPLTILSIAPGGDVGG